MRSLSEQGAKIFGLSGAHARWMPYVLCIFAVAAFLRLGIAYWAYEHDPQFFFDDDSREYVAIAENLIAGNGFSWDTTPPFEPNSYRTPGYPLFLVGHAALFGSFVPALVTQVFLSLLTALLIVRIAAKHLRAEYGIIAAAIFLFMPFSVMVSVRYLTQVAFTTAVTAAVWAFLEYADTRRIRHMLLTGILLPLAALIRPIASFIIAPFIAAAGLGALWKYNSWRHVVIVSIVLAGMFLAGIAPWLWRNHQVFGEASFSSLMSTQLYFYDGPSIYAKSHGISYEEALRVLEQRIDELSGSGAPHNRDFYYQFSSFTPTLIHEGIANAFADPGALLAIRGEQFIKFFVRDGVHYWFERYAIEWRSGIGLLAVLAERGILAILMLGFFISAGIAIARKQPATALLTLIVLYFAVLSGVMSSAGLRYPAEPIIVLLGISGIGVFAAWIRARLKPALP